MRERNVSQRLLIYTQKHKFDNEKKNTKNNHFRGLDTILGYSFLAQGLHCLSVMDGLRS